MDLSNTALLTHKGCMDGSTCAIVFCAAGGKRENVFFSNPGHDETDEKFNHLLDNWEGPIILADVSVSYDMALTVDDHEDCGIYLFDHHKTAIPLNEFRWCEIEANNHRSGAKMLYDFLSKVVPLANWKGGNPWSYNELVNAADDIDRWIKDIPESEILAVLHNAMGQELFVKRFLSNPSLTLNKNEQFLLEVRQAKAADKIQAAKNDISVLHHEVDGQLVRIAYLCNNGSDQSQLGHAIYEDIELDVDAVVIIGNKSISMRASPTCPLDLSAVAKLNGGGGHTKAAGCGLDKVLGQSLVELVQEKLRLR